MPIGIYPHKRCSLATKKKISRANKGRVMKPEWIRMQRIGMIEAMKRRYLLNSQEKYDIMKVDG